MGKTPGKWIKALLSGKKSSKKRDYFKSSINKDLLVSDPIVDSSLISQSTSGANATEGALSEKGLVIESSNDRVVHSARNEEANAQASDIFGSQDDPQKIKLDQAAIKAQAAFRGYQARCAFQKLKVIIHLQALIRGRLVRRQAISTLYCVKGIVKFQALARGYKVRQSDIGHAVHEICKNTKHTNAVGVFTSSRVEKLSKNVFVHKLLASSSSVFPPHLYYNHGEPNMAWEWLDRWTRSHFWAPLSEYKTELNSASNEKNSSNQKVENGKGQVKRKPWKVSSVKVDDGSTSDSNKFKQRLKKVSTRHSDQENPQNEVEKSNLNKTLVHKISDRSEASGEKRKHLVRKIPGHTVSDVSEHDPCVSAHKVKDLAVSKSKLSDLEQSQGQAENECDNETGSFKNAKDEIIQGVSDDLNCGNNCISSVSTKSCERRASLPAKLENQNDGIQQNTPRVPSYMAPTESVKARLRGQVSPSLASELVDKNSVTRRHSLSSSINGKLGSSSPRAERLVASSSKVIIKNDRSLSSSRDGTDKLFQPQWRR